MLQTSAYVQYKRLEEQMGLVYEIYTKMLQTPHSTKVSSKLRLSQFNPAPGHISSELSSPGTCIVPVSLRLPVAQLTILNVT